MAIPGRRVRVPDAPARRRRWSATNPGNVAMRGEVERALLHATAAELTGSRAILDLGCGTGWWLERLARHGVAVERLHGLDRAPERVAAAHARVPGADVREGDARRLPWNDGTFGVIYLLLVLSSLESAAAVRATLAEARRVLRPDGVVAVWEPRVPTPWNRRTRWIRRAALRAALGREAESRALTLLPPLARRLGSRTVRLYPALTRRGLLCTHRLWIWRC